MTQLPRKTQGEYPLHYLLIAVMFSTSDRASSKLSLLFLSAPPRPPSPAWSLSRCTPPLSSVSLCPYPFFFCEPLLAPFLFRFPFPAVGNFRGATHAGYTFVGTPYVSLTAGVNPSGACLDIRKYSRHGVVKVGCSKHDGGEVQD